MATNFGALLMHNNPGMFNWNEVMCLLQSDKDRLLLKVKVFLLYVHSSYNSAMEVTGYDWILFMYENIVMI